MHINNFNPLKALRFLLCLPFLWIYSKTLGRHDRELSRLRQTETYLRGEVKRLEGLLEQQTAALKK